MVFGSQVISLLLVSSDHVQSIKRSNAQYQAVTTCCIRVIDFWHFFYMPKWYACVAVSLHTREKMGLFRPVWFQFTLTLLAVFSFFLTIFFFFTNFVLTRREYASAHLKARRPPKLQKKEFVAVRYSVDHFMLTATQPLLFPPLRSFIQ